MTEQDERYLAGQRLIEELVHAAMTQPRGIAFVLSHHDFALVSDLLHFDPPGARLVRNIPVLPASSDQVQGSYLIAEDGASHLLVMQVRA